MPEDDVSEMADAAQVFRVTRSIDDAVGHLIARPLDEAVADRMRAVLDSPDLMAAREALSRLGSVPASPVLRLVTQTGDDR